MGNNHENPTGICWLSDSNFKEQNLKSSCTFLFQKDKCLSVDCYLAVIFEKVNIFDVLQGESDVLTVGEKLLFKRNLGRFVNLLPNTMCLSYKNSVIIYILKKLENRNFYPLKNLQDYDFQWVLNPLVKNIKIQHLLIILQEQLIDIREEENLLYKF